MTRLSGSVLFGGIAVPPDKARYCKALSMCLTLFERSCVISNNKPPGRSHSPKAPFHPDHSFYAKAHVVSGQNEAFVDGLERTKLSARERADSQ